MRRFGGASVTTSRHRCARCGDCHVGILKPSFLIAADSVCFFFQ
jgi:hypothetical protein